MKMLKSNLRRIVKEAIERAELDTDIHDFGSAPESLLMQNDFLQDRLDIAHARIAELEQALRAAKIAAQQNEEDWIMYPDGRDNSKNW